MLAANGAASTAVLEHGPVTAFAVGRAAPSVALRPIRDEDSDFLCSVYASTRAEELAPVPWTDDQKAAFLRHQFEAQHTHYERYYHGKEFDVILVDGEPAGRLYLARWENEIRLVDIALLPPYRGQGVGTRLVHDVMTEAAATGKTVGIHVEMNNPAMSLYERLGFQRQHDDGAMYCFMEWRAGA